MTQFIVNATKSFAFVSSTVTGQNGVFFSKDMTNALSEIDLRGLAPIDVLGVALDLLAEDALALLDAMGAISGSGQDLAGAYALGGMDGLSTALGEMAEAGQDTFFASGKPSSPNESFLPDGFESMSGTGLADMLAWGFPSAGEKGQGSAETEDDSAAAIEALLAGQGELMDGDIVGEVLDGAAAGGAAGGAIGAGVGFIAGSISPDPGTTAAGTFWGAVIGGVVGAIAGGAKVGIDYVEEELSSDDDSMPVDPNNDNGSLSRAEFEELAKKDLNPREPDPETTLPSDPDRDYKTGPDFDEEDLDDLDETTQPDPDDVGKTQVDPAQFDDGLDPLINPGSEPIDTFDFKSPSTGPTLGGGEDFTQVVADNTFVYSNGVSGDYSAEANPDPETNAVFIEETGLL